MQMTLEYGDRRVGQKLKGFREADGMSQIELGRKIGQDPKTIAQIENGERQVTAVELWDLCRAFDVRPHCFFEAET